MRKYSKIIFFVLLFSFLFSVCVCASPAVGSDAIHDELSFQYFNTKQAVIGYYNHDNSSGSVTFSADTTAEIEYSKPYLYVYNSQPFVTDKSVKYLSSVNVRTHPNDSKPYYMVSRDAGHKISFSVLLECQPSNSYIDNTSYFIIDRSDTYIQFSTGENSNEYIKATCDSIDPHFNHGVGKTSYCGFSFTLDLSNVKSGTTFWGYRMRLGCYLREIYPSDSVSNDYWQFRVWISDGYYSDDVLTAESVANALKDALNDFSDDEKSLAEQIASHAVDAVTSSVPDFSADVTNAFDGLITALSYDGTYAKMAYPRIYIPAMQGIFENDVELLPAGTIDFGMFLDRTPENLLTLIRALSDVSLIIFCVFEVYRLISELLTNRKDAFTNE